MFRIALVAVVASLATVPAAANGAAERRSHSCVRAGEVTFRADDGTRLAGHRFGTGRTAVILGHQSQGSLCEWVPYARRLAGLGYFVFAIDFRGHGLSQTRRFPVSQRLAGDVAAAVKTVRRLGKTKVLVVGSSMGGIASLVAGANVRPPVAGVVSLSAPAAFMGMNATGTAPRLRVPVLYVASENDVSGPYEFARDARAMFAATASPDKRLEIVPGSLHGIALLRGSPHVKALVEGFLRSH
jgi:pimeloyl-ACP methyl ester carboxylesterase